MNVLPSVLPLFLTKRFKFWTIAFHSQLNFTIGKHIRELVYSGIFLSPTTLLERKSWSLYDFSKKKFSPNVELFIFWSLASTILRDSSVVAWISKLRISEKNTPRLARFWNCGHQYGFVYARELSWSLFFMEISSIPYDFIEVSASKQTLNFWMQVNLLSRNTRL